MEVASKIANVVNRGAVSASITTSGGSYTIPKGYHNGLGKVTAPTLESLFDTTSFTMSNIFTLATVAYTNTYTISSKSGYTKAFVCVSVYSVSYSSSGSNTGLTLTFTNAKSSTETKKRDNYITRTAYIDFSDGLSHSYTIADANNDSVKQIMGVIIYIK